jgi:hypothetical protein
MFMIEARQPLRIPALFAYRAPGSFSLGRAVMVLTSQCLFARLFPIVGAPHPLACLRIGDPSNLVPSDLFRCLLSQQLEGPLVKTRQATRREQLEFRPFRRTELHDRGHCADRPGQLPCVHFVLEMCFDRIERLAQLCDQIFARLPNQLCRLTEEDPQLFLSGRVVRERYPQLQIVLFNRAVGMICPEIPQSIQPVFLPLVGE